MDTSGLLASFMTGSYTVKRTAAGSFAHGKAVVGTVTLFSINATVHPASGQDLLCLEEGRRSNETRVVFTPTQLSVNKVGDAYQADKVVIDGEDWECQHRETWVDPSTRTVYYRHIVQAVAP